MELTFTLFVELVLALVLLLLFWLRQPRRLVEMMEKFPGPPSFPLVGNALQLGTNPHDLYLVLEKYTKQYYGSPFRLWLGTDAFVMLNRPKDLEIVMGSNKLIDKAQTYKFLHPWLGTGLLTSTGTKWRQNRKILTPAFHFKILEEFIEVFYSNGQVLIECLQEKVGSPQFNIHHYISLSTLDNICETAMGMKVNALKDADSSYVKAVRWQSDCSISRMTKPWLRNELVFYLTGMKTQQEKTLQILHGTTESVIKARREVLVKEREKGVANDPAPVSDDGTKRRLAFLDLLIESTFNNSGLTDENIREEVDTFMFEGHDTTAAAITFSLWLLSWHQDIQDAVVAEVLELWPDNSEPITYKILQELKLLERVIKESLRLYPSVPFYARKLQEDVELSGGLVAPKGSNTLFLSYMAHLDPEIFPDPHKFDPDRFLPENVQGRHPYAYTPFSAGPRNCIGQKFAMFEMKCTLAQVLRRYKFSPGAEKPELILSPELILTVKDGVPVKIQER